MRSFLHDVTLVGLIAEGGQGMRTANNGRFLGYLEGTEQAATIQARQKELLDKWKSQPTIKPVLDSLLKENNGEFETVVEPLKSQFDPLRDLQLKRGEIYRIVRKAGIADPYTWDENARLSVIHEGLDGPKNWVPFRKGDPEGNKWTDNEPIYINWSKDNVSWLFENSGKNAPIMPVLRNVNMYFTAGVSYTLLGNHTSLKAKLQQKCVFDASASRLTPIHEEISAHCFLAILNSNLFSFIIKKFLKNTAAFEISDLRMAPLIVPDKGQAAELEALAQRAIESKELSFKGAQPPEELIDFCRQLANKQKSAPGYMRPPKQLKLITSAEDCLTVIELAVHWAVEQLYGVEGYGPFSEF